MNDDEKRATNNYLKNKPRFVREAVRKKIFQSEFAKELKAIADKVKKMREDREEQDKQLEFSL